MAPEHSANVLVTCFAPACTELELYDILGGLQWYQFYHDTVSEDFHELFRGASTPNMGAWLSDSMSELLQDMHFTVEFVA